MDKAYDPKQIESQIYKRWEENGYFNHTGHGTPYCIMLPPPNVTGSLHMGHAFQQTLMDILIRYHRMEGNNTLWQSGTDHAGIATQMVVERQLLEKGQSRQELGRDVFIQHIREWKKNSGNIILQQMRRLGASCEWQRERFTMDLELSKAVQTVFIQLYDEGLIYRKKRLVNWDPQLHTAVSDLEVESEEENGQLWYIRYPLVNGSDQENSNHDKNYNSYLVVATTRPETLLGDVAVAVNPEDPRYKNLIGKMVCLPLTDRFIPVIADESVDKTFGTGCVKITPAHDFNDFAMGERHQLPSHNIFNLDATLNETVPKAYQGLDRFVARKKIIQDLTDANLIDKIEPHTLHIPRGDRSGAILEPMLTDQWFVKIAPLAEPAIAAVANKSIRFVPENWENTYFAWMRNIQDWCISRQLWWGHRIPAWYDDAGHIYVAESEGACRTKYQLPEDLVLHQDEDVLDTWFSSALWPFSTLGWPNNTKDFHTFYPTSVLVTGFDIIFFWVARMIMFGIKFTGKIPFHEIYIHGLIRDPNGQKMSKTKGNVLDPLDIIDGIDLEPLIKKRITGLMQPQMAETIIKNTRAQFPKGIAPHGTDALRFSFAAFATTGRDIRFDLARVEGYRHFCNKLWNAARFVLMNTEGKVEEDREGTDYSLDKTYSLVDQWIQSKWQRTKADIKTYISQYRFDFLAQTLYEFTWNEFCDWYLELAKPVLTKSAQNSDKEKNAEKENTAKRGTRYTLLSILEELLRALHPIMPFITEEIWQRVAPLLEAKNKVHTIMLQPYPKSDGLLINISAEEEIEWIKSVILAIRNIRGEMKIAPNKLIDIYIWNANDLEIDRLHSSAALLKFLAKLSSVNTLHMDSSEFRAPASKALVNEMEIRVLMEGLIDIDQEVSRVKKEIDKIDQELTRINAKLNDNFKARAPLVYEKEVDRRQELMLSRDKLSRHLKELFIVNKNIDNCK